MLLIFGKINITAWDLCALNLIIHKIFEEEYPKEVQLHQTLGLKTEAYVTKVTTKWPLLEYLLHFSLIWDKIQQIAAISRAIVS
jgi:hypothetical protein